MKQSSNGFAALVASNIEYSYRDSVGDVLRGLCASFGQREVVGILGPNGSGKTTLLKNLLLYLKPKSGVVSYFGKPHTEFSSRHLARNLALVPQRSGGGETLTVHEMVLLGRLPHLENRWTGYADPDLRAVDNVLAALDIEQFRNRPCASLSGGEFQKVLLARAFVQESEILLLDEATANLDMHHAVDIMDLVAAKASDGAAVVAVMHDLNLAAAYCDRVLLMKDGVVRYEGRPQEVYSEQVMREIYQAEARVDFDEDGVPFVLPRLNRKSREAAS